MKISKYILAACLLTGMAACDVEKEVAVYSKDSQAIHIDVAISAAYNRSNPLSIGDAQKQFSEGDRVQIACEDGNMTFELSNGAWIPTDYNYLRWGSEPLTYTAFYPVTEGTSTQQFNLPTNQQSLDAIARADYMTCTVDDAVNDGSNLLHLSMVRQMAKIVMKLDGVDVNSKANGVKIGSYSGYSSAEPEVATSLITPFVTAASGAKPGQNGTTYTAIVVPGEAKNDATFVSLNYSGEELVLPGIPTLRAGQSYEFTLTVEGSVIKLSDPIVTPWIEGTLTGGDAEELVLDAYYVKPQPTGNGTGLDWDNAMGEDALRSLLRTNGNTAISDANAAKIDGKTIYVAGGEYEIVKDNAGIKIEYSLYKKQVFITIIGGFDPASKGSDRSNRDIAKYVTTFVRNTSSTASSTSDAMILLGNQSDVLFDGCTFDGKYTTDDVKGAVRAFRPSAGSTGDATVRLKECVVKNFNYIAGGNNGGGAMRIDKGRVYMDRVTICNNAALNRGGAINTSNDASYLFMNRCTFYDNYASGAWSTAIHAGKGYVCMNNTTILGTSATATNSITVNGDAYFMLANTTILSNSGNPNGAFRAGGNGKNAVLVNSLFGKGAGTKTIYAGNINSGGYNVYQAADANWGAVATDTDYSSVTLPDAKLTNGVYQWLVEGDLMSDFATKAAVVSAVKSFPVGQLFVDWVGEDAFGVDQRGVARNAQKMQPGAYDAVLND